MGRGGARNSAIQGLIQYVDNNAWEMSIDHTNIPVTSTISYRTNFIDLKVHDQINYLS